MPVPSRDEFLAAVLKEVKYSWDHYLIKQELNDHIDEKIEDFMNDGMDEEHAENEAVLLMGDPVEIGIELNEVHKPLWGYLLFLIRSLIVVLVIALSVQFVYPAFVAYKERPDYGAQFNNILNNQNIMISASQGVNLEFDMDSYTVTIDRIYYDTQESVYFYAITKPKSKFHLFENHLPYFKARLRFDGVEYTDSLRVLYDFGDVAAVNIMIPEGAKTMEIEIQSKVQTFNLMREIH